MKAYKHLFEPIRVGRLTYKNRILLSPQNPHVSPNGDMMSTEFIEFYRKFAQGGAAQISIGCTPVNREPLDAVRGGFMLRLGSDSSHIGLSRFADMAHMYGCKAAIEVFAMAKGEIKAYSNRGDQGKNAVEIMPADMSVNEIQRIAEDFASAAERCVKAGMDTIVYHGAHGQLSAAFFSKAFNERTDEFGTQTLENRARFTDLVLDAIRAKVGNRLTIEYRISMEDMVPNSPTFDELVWFVQHIQDRIDVIHVSKGLHNVHRLAPYMFQPLYFEHGINLDNAAKLKEQVNIPVCAVGSVTIDQAEEAIASGKLDFVAMARGLYADPNLPRKAMTGHADQIRPCVRCNQCINNTHTYLLPTCCSVNAENAREVIYSQIPAPTGKRKVAVVGGGPGGMEAARVAAKRGHEVTLYEKADHLGGAFEIASMAEFKKDNRNYIDWSSRDILSTPGIRVLLNTEATAELLKDGGYDVVIVANGSNPIYPAFLRGKQNVCWVGDVELGHVSLGDRVVIAGAGLSGCETAWLLAEKGKKVTMIDMQPRNRIGAGGSAMNMSALMEKLDELHVEILCETKLEDVQDDGIVVSTTAGTQKLPCDNVVLALGLIPNTALGEQLYRELDCEVVSVGDCMTRMGTLRNAVSTGHMAGYNIF